MSHPTYRKRTIPKFVFEHAGSHKPLAWPKYKLKECWTLVLCLQALRGQTGAVIVHNWWNNTTVKFSREFQARLSAIVDLPFKETLLIEPHANSKVLRLFTLLIALGLALLPVRTLITVARIFTPKEITGLVTFCDGHLAGFALALGARKNGIITYTLQHGLYRKNDRGSRMCIWNFVSDRILLWDTCTKKEFIDAGVASDRLKQIGVYGFGNVSVNSNATDPELIILCPPYDRAQIPMFNRLATILNKSMKVSWSLHPIMRASHPNLSHKSIATIIPHPAIAICGDSGALMEALRLGVPVITVADRAMTVVTFAKEALSRMDASMLEEAMAAAKVALQTDRETFGFSPEFSEGDRLSSE